MTEFECKHCNGRIENPDKSFEVECPHCERILFGCQVCGEPLKGVGSHFAFASPRRAHSQREKKEFKEKIEQWKKDQRGEQRKRSESEIRRKWISQNNSKYANILTEVPVGKGRISGNPRRIDVVAIREVIEIPGYIGNQRATRGEQWLANEALRSADFPTEKKLQMLQSRHQGSELVVEVYEVKTELNPRALGQLLVYSHQLPKDYNVEITQRGIIFGGEYRKDRICASVAEELEIALTRI